MSEPNQPSLRAIILKVASPCNLLCDYCYEYNSGDISWKNKPKLISHDVINMLCSRIEEHQKQVSDNLITIVLHGGEPLLIGYSKLESLLKQLRENFKSDQVQIVIQTNGTLLSTKYISLLKAFKVIVGISIDGNKIHNSHRVDRRGTQSWDRAIRGIELLKKEAPEIFGGILSVMNLDANAAEVVKSLGAFGPPSIDLLQPFANHEGHMNVTDAERFGEWFIEAMKVWLDDKNLYRIKARVFSDVFLIVAGRDTTSDWFGAPRPNYVVIETDGSYALLDSLKTIGFESDKIRNYQCTLTDTNLQHALIRSEQLLESLGAFDLPSDCSSCRWSKICRGGYIVSRYSHKNRFNNRSIYCAGLLKILDFTKSMIDENKLIGKEL